MKVRLFALAHGRSGDKGDSVNIGVIARDEKWFEFISKELTRARVAKFLKPLAKGPVERHELPNLGALNFVVHRALDGGGSLSMRLDAQGKTYAQAVLRIPVEVPAKLLSDIKKHWAGGLPSECLVGERNRSKQ